MSGLEQTGVRNIEPCSKCRILRRDFGALLIRSPGLHPSPDHTRPAALPPQCRESGATARTEVLSWKQVPIRYDPESTQRPRLGQCSERIRLNQSVAILMAR